jgi:hypothetical protein
LFCDIDPNWVLDNVLEMLLHVLLALRYQLATRSPRREHRLEGFHGLASFLVGGCNNWTGGFGNWDKESSNLDSRSWDSIKILQFNILGFEEI